MRNKWIKRFFPLIALFLLAPWPIAYAHSYDGDTANQDAIKIEAAEPALSPTWTAVGKAIGGISTPGDLFYIDATNTTADTQVNLYITNTEKLIRCYRYLILKVGLYVETSTDQWEKARLANGELTPDTFITLLDSQVSFTLPGYEKYKVTIDSGSFYCANANVDGDSLSPQFYLTAN